MLVVGLVIPLAVSAQDTRPAAPETLVLDDAVRLALDNNRQLRIAALDVGKAEEQVAAATKKRYPQFSLSVLGSYLLTPLNFHVEAGQFGTFESIGPVPPINTAISTPQQFTTFVVGNASQPLSQLYQINLGVQAKEVGTELSRETLRQHQQDVVEQVKQTFYGLLETQSGMTFAEETLKYVQELDRLTDRYVVQRVALKSDALNVKAELSRAQYQLLVLRNSFVSQQEQFNALLGRDLRVDFRVAAVEEPTGAEVDLEAARTRAIEQRPEIRQARLKAKQADLDYRIQKSKFIPDLSIAFNYVSTGNVDFLPKNVASAGFYLSWEPFDWGIKHRDLAQKALTMQQSDYSVRDTEQTILAEVSARFRKLQEARSYVQVARLGRETETEKLRVVMTQYAVKAALLKDTLQQKASLADANNQYQQALLSFWTAKAAFEKSLGEH